MNKESQANDEDEITVEEISDEESEDSEEEKVEIKEEKKEKKDPFVDIKKSEIKQEFIEDKYDIGEVTPMLSFHKTYVVCGPSGSGKSQLLKFLYNSYKDLFHLTIVFSGSYFDYEFEDVGIPRELHQPLNETKINAVIEALKMFKNQGIDFHTLIIFDDTTSNIDLQHSKLINQIVTQARHYNTSCFLTAHWLSKLSRVILESTKFFFVFQSTRESLSRIREYTNYTDQQLWDMYCANMQEEYQFMFIQKIRPNKKMLFFMEPLPNVESKMIGKIL